MKEGLVDALTRIEAIAALGLPPRQQFDRLVRTHLDTLLGAGQDFIPVVLYEWRSLEPAARRRVSVLLKRYEAVWAGALAQLREAGDWPGTTRIDALLLFGALNWIARWYDPRGALDVRALADECIRFFLRAPPAPVRNPKASARSKRPAR
jgi:TetR/AcrR family transcriptional regulator, cholesterol catabolism regulator